MNSNHFSTPVLLMVYNRPDCTGNVFEAIKSIKPARLFIAADGPKAGSGEDALACEKTRAVISNIDWECEVQTLFRTENLGCKKAVSSAIDWFFSHVEEGIILEDDCLPSTSFFFFCKELLLKYRNDKRVLHISGNNFQNGTQRGNASYYFSIFTHVWGWATWKRAWKLYDIEMKQWPCFRDNGYLKNLFSTPKAIDYWTRIFDAAHTNEIDTWDYQWTFSCWAQSGLSILPNINLVKNIGFGPQATHTKQKQDFIEKMRNHDISNPLKHPDVIIRNQNADAYTQKTLFKKPNLIYLIYRKLLSLL